MNSSSPPRNTSPTSPAISQLTQHPGGPLTRHSRFRNPDSPSRTGQARTIPRLGAGSVDDRIAGGTYRGQVRDVENEEGQLHHIAEAGPGVGQAAAQVLKHLPRLRRRIPGPDQFTALVLRNLPADDHQPALAGDHLAVAAPGGYSVGSYHVLQHAHESLSFTWPRSRGP